MPNTVLGKVSVTPKGAWSGSSSYEKLDIVSNGGNSYIALQNVPAGTALSNSSYWLMIAQKGDKGDKGDTGATGATGATGNGISSVEVEETSVVGNVHTYTLTISMTDGTSEVFTYDVTDGAVTSVNGRTGAVTGLAEDNGYYEDMTVGGAEQLISSTYVEDSVPYVFRTSGGSADIGDREFDEIHGGTIAWNQLMQNTVSTSTTKNGVTVAYNDGVYSLSGTATEDTSINIGTADKTFANHVYFRNCLFGSSSTYFLFGIGDASKRSYLTQIGKASVDASNSSCTLRVLNGVNVDGVKFSVGLHDLTQMFGSTIADYIYSLEQANAGAGVAWFKSLFPKPYYAYNAGQLISVSGLSAHKMTGFNQWDEEWELGLYNTSTGLPQNAQSNIRSKNAIRVVPSTPYCFYRPVNNGAFNIFWYDADDNFLVYESFGTAIERKVFASPSNACYLRFYMGSGYGTTYKNDICINLHWDGERDGEYEPYEAHEYALDSDVVLSGIPKLDADNKLYYDGDVYASDGTVQRRYGIVDLGTLNWVVSDSSALIFKCSPPNMAWVIVPPYENRLTGAICSKYPPSTAFQISSATTDKSWVRTESNFYIRDTAYSDATAFKTAMNGVMLVYELATPTTESAEPYTSPQWVDDFGTEEYVIAEQSGVAMPVGHETKYTANLKAKLEMAPNSPSGDGDYIVRQTGGINTYVPLTERIPNAPSENGNYILKCTVSGSTVTYTWESAT